MTPFALGEPLCGKIGDAGEDVVNDNGVDNRELKRTGRLALSEYRCRFFHH
jgi:hypothetical protein